MLLFICTVAMIWLSGLLFLVALAGAHCREYLAIYAAILSVALGFGGVSLAMGVV